MRISKLFFVLATIGVVAVISDSRVEAGSASTNLNVTAAVGATARSRRPLSPLAPTTRSSQRQHERRRHRFRDRRLHQGKHGHGRLGLGANASGSQMR